MVGTFSSVAVTNSGWTDVSNTEFVPGKLVVKTGVRSESSAVADEGGSWKIVSVTVSVTVTVSTFPGSCRDQKLRRLDRFWRP